MSTIQCQLQIFLMGNAPEKLFLVTYKQKELFSTHVCYNFRTV